MRRSLVITLGGLALAVAPVAEAGSCCPADIDDNCIVDVEDLLLVVNQWAQVGAPADVVPPPGVDTDDLLFVVNSWGPCPTPVNDLCADAIPIFDGLTAYDTNAAVTDGPAHPVECTDDGDGGNTTEDIWFTYTAMQT